MMFFLLVYIAFVLFMVQVGVYSKIAHITFADYEASTWTLDQYREFLTFFVNLMSIDQSGPAQKRAAFGFLFSGEDAKSSTAEVDAKRAAEQMLVAEVIDTQGMLPAFAYWHSVDHSHIQTLFVKEQGELVENEGKAQPVPRG
eukprot:COSAG02_NODE_14872_length_1227_cov_4.407801_2_plen_143_part_00